MYKFIPLMLLLLVNVGEADHIGERLEGMRHKLTHFYHHLLTQLDNTIPCDANCSHPEALQIRTNRLHLVTSIKTTKQKRFYPSVNLRGNIYLPKLSKKFRITFTKQGADTLTNRQIDRENENLVTDNKLRLGLQYLFVMTQNIEFATRLGLKWNHPLGLYQEISAKRRFSLPRDYALLAKGSLHYYLTNLFLSRSLQLTLIKPLSETFLVAQSNDWYANTENHHEKHLVHHLKLHHHCDHKNHFVYWISYASLASEHDRYCQDWQALSLSYIHYLTKWLYIQTIPRIVQRRENHFRNEYEASLSFGIIFGK